LLVLLDTTILTNFARVGLTQLMTELWGEQVCTTVRALDEYQVGVGTAGLPPLAWKQLRLIKLSPEEELVASTLFPRLGLGERTRTCLAVAVVRGSMLATDDKPARHAAKQHSIQVIGSIGILRSCAKHGILSKSEAQVSLEKMIAAGYYSPVLKLDYD
jgi:predicted nucleic acid-binding protein